MVRIGIDLGGTKIEGIALQGSREIARLRLETPRDDYPGTLDAIVRLVRDLEQRAGGPATVGVGIPGTVSSATGLVKNANSVWLIGRPLRDDLQDRLRREVRLANDANCFAVSEAADGAAAGARVVFGAIVGTGTGAGIVVDGRVLVGPNAIAGEWGHNPLPWPQDEERPGPACYCGLRGCVETFLSGPALSAEHERRTGDRLSAEAVVARAGAGEAAADETLQRYEHRMARALAAVINVLDPDVIVLGGGLSNVERLYERVPRAWGPYVFACASGADPGSGAGPASGANRASGADPSGSALSHDPVRTRLVRARHGAASGVRGAAWLWPDV